MTKLSRILMFLVCLLTSSTWVTQAYGQNTLTNLAPPSVAGTTTQVRAPNGTAAAMRAVVVVIPSELTPVLGASNSIRSLGFSLEARPLPNAMSGTVNIYMVNTTDATNTRGLDWTVATTSMTQVCTNCAFTVAPNAASYDITLATPFAYTGQGLYVAYDFTVTSTLFPVPTAATDPIATYLATNILPASTSSYQGVAPASNTLGASAFRPEFRFGTPNPLCPTAVVVTPVSGALALTAGTAITPITLGATGGAAGSPVYAYVISAGTLPGGLTLTGNTISGTPTTSGTGTFTVRATSTPGGCTGTATYTFAVNPAGCTTPVVVTPVSGTVSFITGTAITPIALGASGGPTGTPTYAYTISAGTLPAGLTLTGNTISGTPTAAGSGSFAVTATSTPNACFGTATYTFTVCSPVVVTPPSGAVVFTSGVAITPITLGASGGATGATYAYVISAGALPNGLTLSAGTISGTPLTAGIGSFTVRATSTPNGCTGTATYTFTVSPPVTCTAVIVTPPSGAVVFATGSPITPINLGASGGAAGATYAYTITGGGLPAGLTLVSATGVISGTPTAIGTGTFTVTATSAPGACTGTATYNFTVNFGCTTVVVTPVSGAVNFVSGTAITPITVSASGGATGATYAYNVSAGALPAGLALAGATGIISGTPTAAAVGTGSFTIGATSTPGTCTGTAVYTFRVLPACTPVVITPLLSALNFLVGAPITSITLAATGGDPSATYTYAILAGAGAPGPLPAGLTLAGGVISGTPAGVAGTSGSFTVVATSTVTSPTTRSCVGNATYTYAIKSDCAVVLATTSLPEAIVGTPYTHTFVATGGVGATYAFSNTTPLPAGLTLDSATGVLSGTPTVAASITLLVTAKSPTPSTCSATLGYGLNVRLNTLTSIDNSLANLVKVSPNPSKGDFNIDFSTINMAKSSIRVYDAQGKVVFASENNNKLMTISLEKFANGIYLMEVETSKGRILKRLAKQ